MKLYQFSHKATDEVLFVYTDESPAFARHIIHDYDHGGLDYEIFNLLANKGEVTQITKLEEVPLDWIYNIPYGETDYSIRQLFDKNLIDINIKKLEKKLIICRGISGSGKSTLAKSLQTEHLEYFPNSKSVILSTDETYSAFSGSEKLYLWTPEALGLAHKLNQAKCKVALERGIDNIIIDNTNTTFDEMKPYVELAIAHNYQIEVIESDTNWRYNIDKCAENNIHNVPKFVVEKQLERLMKNPTHLMQVKIRELVEKKANA